MTEIDLLLSFLFGVLALGSIYWARIAFNNGLAPLGLYLGVTFSTLSLWHMKLVSLIQISPLAYFIALLSVFGFIIGSFIGAPGKHLRATESVNVCYSIIRGRYLKNFFFVIGVLSTTGWVVLLFMFVRDYSFATIWEEPYLLQTGFQSRRYFGYLNLLGILVLPTYILLARTRRGAKWPAFVFVISALIGLLLAGIKSYIVFSFVTAFLVWGNFRRTGAPLRYMVMMAIIFIIFMIIYDRVVDVFHQNLDSESALSSVIPGLSRPYTYMVGSWSALTVLADNPIPQPVFAYQSLMFVWKVLGGGLEIVSLIPEPDTYFDIAETGTLKFNVFSMAGGLYWDFGLIGVMIGSAFWGFVSTRLYEKARKSRDWAWLLSSSIINYGLFLSFFTYYFTFNLLFLFAVVLMAIIFRGVVNIYRMEDCALSNRSYRTLVDRETENPKGSSVDSKNGNDEQV